jgi:dihydrofolate reductase
LKIIIIASVSNNGIIGYKNKLPWHIPEDLQHFKSTTMGHAILMGRFTFESIGKPLPGRINYIISKKLINTDSKTQDFIVMNNFEDIVYDAFKKGCKKLFIIGGGQVYSNAINLADQMIITLINREYSGDVYFPKFNENEWEIKMKKVFEGYDIINYIRSSQKKVVF